MRAKELGYPVILFLGFFLLYYAGSYSKIPFGDCIGFVADTEKGNFVLSTSTYAHFLFTNTLVFFKRLLPFVGSPEIGRYVVIFSSCICLLILYRTVLEVAVHRFAAIFSTVIFGLSFTFWRNTEIIEIYTFNLIWISLFLMFSLRFLREKKRPDLLLASLFLGISLFSHIQNILMVPALLLLILYAGDRKNAAASLSVFILFAVLLIAVPLLTHQPVSKVFSAGTVLDSLNIQGIIKGFVVAVGYLVYNFWYFTLFAFAGILWLFRTNKRVLLFLGVAGLPVFGFAGIFGVSDNYVFFLPFNYIIAVLFGLGISRLWQNNMARYAVFTAFLIPFFYFASFKMAGSTAQGLEFHSKKAYKGGLSYYLLPWMNNNVGILEFVLEKRESPDPMHWMEKSAWEFIQLKSEDGYSDAQLKKL